MNVLSLSAITITSNNPRALANFYRERLGIPLEASSHGPIREHFEGWLGAPERGGVHVAVLKGRAPAVDAGGTAPTFCVDDLDGFVRTLHEHHITPVHPIASIGEGKRLASFRDPDGNVFRLIEIAA